MDQFQIALLVLSILIGIGIVGLFAKEIDLALAKPLHIKNADVLNKKEGVAMHFTPSRSMIQPKRYYWRVSVLVEDKAYDTEVSRPCYESLKIGDKTNVTLRKGKFFTGVTIEYPKQVLL